TPLCQLRGYEQHAYNGFQLPFDQHEWDYNSWYDRGVAAPTVDWYRTAAGEQRLRNGYMFVPACATCAVRPICDGFHQQYVRKWGENEATPYDGNLISD